MKDTVLARGVDTEVKDTRCICPKEGENLETNAEPTAIPTAKNSGDGILPKLAYVTDNQGQC